MTSQPRPRPARTHPTGTQTRKTPTSHTGKPRPLRPGPRSTGAPGMRETS